MHKKPQSSPQALKTAKATWDKFAHISLYACVAASLILLVMFITLV